MTDSKESILFYFKVVKKVKSSTPRQKSILKRNEKLRQKKLIKLQKELAEIEKCLNVSPEDMPPVLFEDDRFSIQAFIEKQKAAKDQLCYYGMPSSQYLTTLSEGEEVFFVYETPRKSSFEPQELKF